MASLSPRYRHATMACAVALGFTEGLARAQDAGTNVKCASLPNPVYGQGGSAQRPLLGLLAAKLRKADPPVSIVYPATGACTAVYTVIGTLTNSPAGKIKGTASYWEADGTRRTCDLDALDGNDVQFGVMGPQAASCDQTPSPLPAGFGEFLGPAEAATFIVPLGSNEQVISAAAAYFVFAFGAAGQASPWTDDPSEKNIIRRDANSFLTVFLGKALNLPTSKLTVHGVDAKTNEDTVALVAAVADPQKGIGIVAGEVADAYSSSVKKLAYQHFGQSCGYWPDSTQHSLDRRNVRTGQYYLWNPIHLFAKVDAQNHILDPAAAKIVGYFTGEVAPPSGINMLELQIKGGTVPKCAMEVWRTQDLGDLQSNAPDVPCGCYFDYAATGSTTCQECTTDDTCPTSAPHCRYGFCEVN